MFAKIFHLSTLGNKRCHPAELYLKPTANSTLDPNTLKQPRIGTTNKQKHIKSIQKAKQNIPKSPHISADAIPEAPPPTTSVSSRRPFGTTCARQGWRSGSSNCPWVLMRRREGGGRWEKRKSCLVGGNGLDVFCHFVQRWVCVFVCWFL